MVAYESLIQACQNVWQKRQAAEAAYSRREGQRIWHDAQTKEDEVKRPRQQATDMQAEYDRYVKDRPSRKGFEDWLDAQLKRKKK